MDTLFLNFENSQTSESHILVLKLTNNLYLRAVINLKYQLQHEMINLNYQMDDTLYQTFKIILNMIQENIMKILKICH